MAIKKKMKRFFFSYLVKDGKKLRTAAAGPRQHKSRSPRWRMYQVITLEPGIGQFCEFEPRRVHTRINSLGLFLVHKLTCGSARA